MRYTDIKIDKPVIIIHVSGCSHACLNCNDVNIQDPREGKIFTENTLSEVVSLLDNEDMTHCIFRGGDPLYSVNRGRVCDISRTLKAIFGNDKILCLHTGYLLDEIKNMHDPSIDELFNYIDVIIDNDKCLNEKEQSYYRVIHHKYHNEFVAMREE